MQVDWKKIRKVFLWVVGIILGLALIAGGGFMWLMWNLFGDPYSQYTTMKFDKQEWLKTDDDHYYRCVRGQMYDDLQRNYLRKGMSKEQIRELLGETTLRRVYKEWGEEREYIEYEFGSCNNSKHKFLAIHFDKKDKLNKFFMGDNNDDNDEGHGCDRILWSEEGKCIEKKKNYENRHKNEVVKDVR